MEKPLVMDQDMPEGLKMNMEHVLTNVMLQEFVTEPTLEEEGQDVEQVKFVMLTVNA